MGAQLTQIKKPLEHFPTAPVYLRNQAPALRLCINLELEHSLFATPIISSSENVVQVAISETSLERHLTKQYF